MFDNPVLRPADVKVEPRVLSFDIETDAKGERLLAISMYAPGLDEVLIVDRGDGRCPRRRCAATTSTRRSKRSANAFASFDPDVITGWNTIDFDLTVLQRIAARVRHPFELGRDAGAMRMRKAEGYFGSGQATIPGRLVLDGIDLLRGAFVRMDDYSLDAVAREVLGEGKAVAGDVRDRIGEILHNYRARSARLRAVRTHRCAPRLSDRREAECRRLAFARSELTGMTPDRVAASIASFDFLYLSELERRSIVAPTVRSSDSRVHAAQQGGHVLEPTAGLHRNVWVFDFKSLYPSIIRTFNIDPLSYVAEPSPGRRPDRNAGRRVPARARDPAAHARRAVSAARSREAGGDDVASNAIKILMNSFYGVLGTPACRFYNPALANSITGMGREMLLWSKRWFEARGFTVLYGDTDSLFVRSGMDDAERGRGARAEQLARELSAEHRAVHRRALARDEQARAQVRKAVSATVSAARAAQHARCEQALRGAASRRNDGDAVEFVGMEVVRSDWTALAKQVQRELYQRLFADQAVDEYLADIVQQSARRRSSTTRSSIARTCARTPRNTRQRRRRTSPPRASRRKPIGRLDQLRHDDRTARSRIDNIAAPLDREHYVDQAGKPVAEPVLETLGLDFEQVIGDGRQMDMYSLFGEP